MLLNQLLHQFPKLSPAHRAGDPDLYYVLDGHKLAIWDPNTIYLFDPPQSLLQILEGVGPGRAPGGCLVTAKGGEQAQRILELAELSGISWLELQEDRIPLDLGSELLRAIYQVAGPARFSADRIRDELVGELLEGGELGEDLLRRCADLGVHLENAACVLVISFAAGPLGRGRAGPTRSRPEFITRREVWERARSYLVERYPQCSAHSLGNQIVILLDRRLHDPMALGNELLGVLRRIPGGLVVGALGGAYPAPALLARSYQEALWATEVALEDPVRLGMVRFDQVRYPLLLREIARNERIRNLLMDSLQALRKVDPSYRKTLMESLRAYLAEGKSISRASKRLGIHSNTLKYRLKRLGEYIDLHSENSEVQIVHHLALDLGLRLDEG